ncbi:coiled-coil domain-containing protein 115 isoform X2 [Dendrobates tinctorius]|uniref:coiled-coil domain-containing protein 115 isoform X2 n=1 Tax=Dendrobates tinctorius TaxID=92724 RepID=UPI003CCA505D
MSVCPGSSTISMEPSVNESPVDVNQHLDQLLLRVMDDLEDLKEKRQRLNAVIEKGWLCISQSRYSMGNKSVCSLQYMPEMTPFTFVQDSAAEDGLTTFTAEHVQPNTQDKVTEEKLPEVENVGSTDQVLRHRGHKCSKESPKPTTAEEREMPKSPVGNDPLRWFGVLVPQSLRQAQSNFRQGTILAAEVASLQSSIEENRQQYRALLAQKKREQVQSG